MVNGLFDPFSDGCGCGTVAFLTQMMSAAFHDVMMSAMSFLLLSNLGLSQVDHICHDFTTPLCTLPTLQAVWHGVVQDVLEVGMMSVMMCRLASMPVLTTACVV